MMKKRKIKYRKMKNGDNEEQRIRDYGIKKIKRKRKTNNNKRNETERKT